MHEQKIINYILVLVTSINKCSLFVNQNNLSDIKDEKINENQNNKNKGKNCYGGNIYQKLFVLCVRMKQCEHFYNYIIAL